MDFQNKTILLTGATSGIGLETAKLLDNYNATLILLGRSQQKLSDLTLTLKNKGHQTYFVDLSSTDHIEYFNQEYDFKIDGFVHCAGLQITKPIAKLEISELEEMTMINYTAAVLLTQAFCKQQRFNPNSSLVYVSSIMSHLGAPAVSHYSATKGALTSLMRSLALELAPKQLRVNCVAPGYVSTPMLDMAQKYWTQEQKTQLAQKHPLGLGQPEQIAKPIAFLLSDLSNWITGTTLVVDGGYSAQ